MSVPVNFKPYERTAKIEEAMRLLQEVLAMDKQSQASNQIMEQGASEDLIPYSQALEWLGMGKTTFLRKANNGEIPIHRLSPKKIYVSRKELAEYIRNL